MEQIRMILHQRVSTLRQRVDGSGLDTQLRENREYAKALNAIVVKEITSDFANEGNDRADIDEIISLLKSGVADSVMFWDIDRSTRGGLGEWFLLTKELQSLGATIYYGHRRSKAGESPEEEAMDGVYAIFANLEKKKIKDRTMGGFKSKALQGKYIGHGRLNYAYQRVGNSIAPDDNAIHIQDIFNRFTGWNGYTKQSVRDIVKSLYGIPTPADTNINIRKSRGFGVWSEKTIYKILRNPIYKGVYTVHRYKSVGYTKSRNKQRYIKVVKRNSNEQISISVPAIVSELQWELAQQILDEGRTNSTRNTKHEYLLAKRIRCGECNCIMRGKVLNRKNKQYKHYRCHGNDASYAHVCTMSAVSADTLETQLWEWLQRRFLTEDNYARTLTADISTHNVDTQIQQLVERLNKLEDEDSNLRRQARKGIISDEELAESRIELKQEKQQLQETIERLQRKKNNEMLLNQHRQHVTDMLSKYKTVINELSFGERRALLEALDIRVTIWNTRDIMVKSVFEYSPELDYWNVLL